jgi:hypothetical protein
MISFGVVYDMARTSASAKISAFLSLVITLVLVLPFCEAFKDMSPRGMQGATWAICLVAVGIVSFLGLFGGVRWWLELVWE